MTDPNRATFVQQEYRYETASNLSIRATFPSARELLHVTNLNESDATALAAVMFADASTNARAFKVQVDGSYDLESIESAPLRFVLNAPTYATDSRISKVTEIESDPLVDRTTFVVRG